MKIGILGKITKVKTDDTIEKLVQLLTCAGHETKRFSTCNEIVDVDVVIVMGGDGAILHSAVHAAKNGVKIIGINYGNLGFLTELEKDETEKIVAFLSELENNTCRIVKRSLLQCEVGGRTFYSLNEVALQRDYGSPTSPPTQILKVEIASREGKERIAGDGILITTPTGSTAYSLSAGGAILTPEVPVFMMTPICAFSRRTRPTVFSNDDEFTITVTRGKALLLIDGLTVAHLPENTQIKIKKAPFTADFPKRADTDFFERVRNKLSE